MDKNIHARNLTSKLSRCFILALCVLISFPINTGSSTVLEYPFFLGRINGPPHATDIICLGDSLTQGIGATPGHDYPSLLAKALGMRVINAGVDGDETEDVLKRLDKDVFSKDPKMVILLIGGNDYLEGEPRKKTLENLDEIIRRIQARGSMVVFAEIGSSVLGSKLQKEYDQIAVSRRVPVVPYMLRSYFFDPALKSDRLHPNDKGYEIIAKHILRFVKPLLERRS